MTREPGGADERALLSTGDVARLLGLSEARIRSFVRWGLCRPGRRGRGYAFDFRDLVVLHAARRLLRAGVPPTRVRRALLAEVERLPEGGSLSALRLDAADGRVTVRDGGATWEAETGQTRLFGTCSETPPAEPEPLEPLELRAGEVAGLVDAFRTRRQGASPGPGAALPPHADADAEFRRALALEQDDAKAATEAYQRALELDPDLGDALVNLGRLHHEAGDLGQALALYRRALERDPLDPVVHFNLALALHDAQGPAAAVDPYRRALELDPEFADAHFNLAAVCEELGERQEALRHYRAYQALRS